MEATPEKKIGSDAAFIIGNGMSRKSLDLNSLVGHGTIYGCNAIYKEFMVDKLVAIDQGMIQEILSSSFPKERVIIPLQEEQYEPEECNKYRPRSNAGMNAMIEAIRNGAKILYCIGFDFIWKDDLQSVSNMFEGQANYGPDTKSNPLDNIGRIRYLTWFCLKNKDVRFYMTYPDEYFDLFQFHDIKAKNILGMTFSRLASQVLIT